MVPNPPPLSPSQQATSNEHLAEHLAAAYIYEAKLREFESACITRLPGHLTSARESVHSALDALLDAKERMFKSLLDAQRQ